MSGWVVHIGNKTGKIGGDQIWSFHGWRRKRLEAQI